jgi:hypothetical protein
LRVTGCGGGRIIRAECSLSEFRIGEAATHACTSAARYKKGGNGSLVKCYVERIVEDFTNVSAPSCLPWPRALRAGAPNAPRRRSR